VLPQGLRIPAASWEIRLERADTVQDDYRVRGYEDAIFRTAVFTGTVRGENLWYEHASDLPLEKPLAVVNAYMGAAVVQRVE
jgi:hypothetical protein